MQPAAPRYSIIIPAQNEADRIGPVLADYLQVFADSELIVVLNGCTDATEQRVREACGAGGEIRLINLPPAVGKGGAVRSGMLVARAPVVGYVDADGATSAAEMRRLCESLGDADALIASRWVRGARVVVPQTRARRFASRVFNLLVRLMFGLPFSDTQCGAKVFRTDAIAPILGRVETANLAFDVDVLVQLRRSRRRIVEVPTTWEDRAGSGLRLLPSALRMFGALVRLRVRDSFLHPLVPLVDRMMPSKPLRIRDHLSILILNWRDIRHPQAGGAELYLHEIARRLVVQGHSVRWLTARFKEAPRRESIDGIDVTRTGNALTVYAAIPLEYVRSCVNRFDLIIDSENGIPFFSPLFSLKPKLCLIHHVHQEVFLSQVRPPLSWLLAWLERRVMPLVYRNAGFVAISQDTRAEMLRLRFTRRPIPVVTSGVDGQLHPGSKSDQPSIVYVGRLKRYKRVDAVLRAFAAVNRQIPEAVLRIAGRGDDEPRLRRLAASLDIEHAVTFEGFVDEANKRRLLQEAWLFATASMMEGWGISVIEANACGTPAVAFDVPGLREAIVDGKTGALVASEPAMTAAIVELLRDRTRREMLSRAAVAHAAGFSWDAAARAMLDAISAQFVERDHGVLLTSAGWQLQGAVAPPPEVARAQEISARD